MGTRPSLKQIRYIPKALFIIIAIYFGLNLFICFSSIGKTKILNVSTLYLKKTTYKHIQLNENSFTTGFKGDLYWKPKTVREAFLLAFSNTDGSRNLYDLFYFLIMNLAVFFMVRALKEEEIFEKLLKT